MQEELNYYSIDFQYKHALHGETLRDEHSSLIIHVSWDVDEEDESDRLEAAIKKVDAALTKLGLEWVPEYYWPNGSLLNLVRTTYGIIELTILLDSVLEGMKFNINPISPLEETISSDLNVEQFFDGRLHKCGIHI